MKIGDKWPFIGGMGSSSVTGYGYSVSRIDSGKTILVVNDVVLDVLDNAPYERMEDLAHAGRMLTVHTKERRAEIIATNYGGKDVTLDGVKWKADGSYAGVVI